MKMFFTFVCIPSVIFSIIECSSHSERNPHYGRYSRPSSSAAAEERLPPEWTSMEESSFRARSRSPGSSPSSIEILGYPLSEIGYVRLIPRSNPSLRFEFRRYVFPAGIPVSWREDGKRFSPVPPREHIVLSASNGEIFAISTNNGVLLGIYRRKRGTPRVKIDMISGAIENLTPDEIKDCPVSRHHPISRQSFIIAFSDHDSLQFKWEFDSEYNPGSSSSVRQHPTERSSIPEESLIRERSRSPSIRPPSDQVLGYTMDQLGYVRLISCRNLNQQFEFRRYIFPLLTPIRMRIDDKRYVFSPNVEYIVLSTSTGDIFAILDHSGTLCGMYRTDKSNSRVKMNMISGALDNMTADEKTECPIGKNRPVFPYNFNKALANFDSLQVNYNTHSELIRGSPPSARHYPLVRTPPKERPLEAKSSSPPGRPPSEDVLGFPLAKLGFIRLVPQSNPHRHFEFRRYVFPPYMKIQLMAGHGKYVSLPNREHIVLTTYSGDVFALLEYTGFLRGIYLTFRERNWAYSRIKVNMFSGVVDQMTELEMKECHVGSLYPISTRLFKTIVSDEDSLQNMYH